MKEIFLSLFDTSKDRIKSPFIGSYITAFIIYNWRAFFLLLFSNAKIEDKIVVINHEYCYKEAILIPSRSYQIEITEDSTYLYDGNRLVGVAVHNWDHPSPIDRLIEADNE